MDNCLYKKILTALLLLEISYSDPSYEAELDFLISLIYLRRYCAKMQRRTLADMLSEVEFQSMKAVHRHWTVPAGRICLCIAYDLTN